MQPLLCVAAAAALTNLSGCGKALLSPEALGTIVAQQNNTPGPDPSASPSPDASASPRPSPSPTAQVAGYVTDTSPLQAVIVDTSAPASGTPGFNIASSVDMNRCLADVNHTLVIVPCADDANQLWTVANHKWTIASTGDCLNFSASGAQVASCGNSPQSFNYVNGAIGNTAGCLTMMVTSTAPYAATPNVATCSISRNLQQWTLYRQSGSAVSGFTFSASASNLCLTSSNSNTAACFVGNCAGLGTQRWVFQADQLMTNNMCLVPSLSDAQVPLAAVIQPCTGAAIHGWSLSDTVIVYRTYNVYLEQQNAGTPLWFDQSMNESWYLGR